MDQDFMLKYLDEREQVIKARLERGTDDVFYMGGLAELRNMRQVITLYSKIINRED